MTLVFDASALVSIIGGEADATALERSMQADPVRVMSGIELWEASRAVARRAASALAAGHVEVERYCRAFDITVVTIGKAESVAAIDAQATYGKGSGHPARLNMGDCFAYACAKTNGATLLYKGDDFLKTDLA